MCASEAAVEHVRVVFEPLQDDLPVDRLLLVEGRIGAYVGDEGHEGFVFFRQWPPTRRGRPIDGLFFHHQFRELECRAVNQPAVRQP